MAGKSALQVRTVIVEGSLASQMRRAAAARANECGLRILGLPQLAARLAGAFTTPVTPEVLDPAIRLALDEAGFVEIEPVRRLPGTARAFARSLRRLWDADIDLGRMDDSNRIRELRLVEERVKRLMPKAVLTTRDLRDAALQRIQYAPKLVGAVQLERISVVQPVWRPLIEALEKVVEVEWLAPRGAETEWFSGTVIALATPSRPAEPTAVSCADPRHEVVETLRWARRLIASGAAKPHEIAIAAPSTAPWDDHWLALAPDADLRVHFAHGVPALATVEGQRCAALADLLLRGLSQKRVRRLVSLSRGQGLGLDQLPHGWLAALPRGAALSTMRDWEHAIAAAIIKDSSLDRARTVLPLLGTLARGPSASGEAAGLFLRGRSLQIWEAATRSAPPDALELSLRNVRLPAETDAADSIVWCTARDLAAAPRPHVRLLGLTNRSWPRNAGDDPILPSHVLSPDEFDFDPVGRADRRHFRIILEGASGSVVLSRSRRSGQGSRLGRSPLLQDRPETALSRARIPEHAFSAADRLMARPAEAAGVARIRSATHCWRNWHGEHLTPHDAQFGADHPVVVASIERVQSATSLRRLLQDPLSFVWRYALGWDAPEEREQPLSISALDFGKLVHELLRRAVDTLEPYPGYAKASDGEIEGALSYAVQIVREAWPLERPVPPKLLWRNTVDYAASLALVGLLRKEISEPGTRSWTEVPFGQPAGFVAGRELPWDPTKPVVVPNTLVRLRGTIDRLDLRHDRSAARVTDYKTGTPPKNVGRIIIGGGAELQRVLYAHACRELLEGDPQIVARLLYLAGEPMTARLHDLDGAIDQISAFINEATALLRRGATVPGRLAFERSNDLRLALPASPGYQRRKRVAYSEIEAGISRFWSAP
ncbi:PD-(D/E)XK nuclease family protein [Bradyrhizobium sp. CB3481]|uniref:PD-(D/E)XK nuclease family protein n=1 Tax=Bradyrhizobium sp. CB3481 TaxID=3039158 RepID=UPI0024B1B501|nr:PD-(D/E)XK nuclease family protein [Bradyrhizobium sp. CB3481]WFU16451.1 PD-(D/E)XK nuclease family protein [Bradyrhizobium sp. CB3481]